MYVYKLSNSRRKKIKKTEKIAIIAYKIKKNRNK